VNPRGDEQRDIEIKSAPSRQDTNRGEHVQSDALRREHGEDSHTMWFCESHTSAGGNFVTRRTHAVSNLELYYENPLVPILHCSFTLLMAAAPRGISSFTSFPSFLHLVPSVPHLDQLCGWWCTWGFRFTAMARTLRYERFYLGNPKGIGEINATRSC